VVGHVEQPHPPAARSLDGGGQHLVRVGVRGRGRGRGKVRGRGRGRVLDGGGQHLEQRRELAA